MLRNRFPLAVAFACSVLMVSGCAALVLPSAPSGAAAIKVSIIHQFQSVVVNAGPITLTAAVQNDPTHKGVSWSLTANGVNCAPGCGVLTPASPPSLTAVYTPPPSFPGGSPTTPTITVVSLANPSKSASFTFALEPVTAITVAISGAFANVLAAAAPQSLAAITNDAQGVVWTLTSGGENCSPLCGSLDFSGGQHLMAVYTPPAILAAGASLDAKITAISISNSTQNASFVFTISRPPNSNYTILLRGYDASGNPLAIAGVFKTDLAGNVGNIIDGELDINDGGTVTTAKSLLGTFSTDTNFVGVIRGTITISNFTFPGTSANPVFKFVLRGNELEARVIEFDKTGNLTAGNILLQSGVSGTTPKGVCAFGLDSDAPLGRRTVVAGAFVVLNDGSIAGVADQSQARAAGSNQAVPLSGAATQPDGLGRGSLSFTQNGTTTNYAYYLAGAGQLDLIQIGGGLSSGTVLAGTARAHTFTFDPINGIYQTSVVQLTGMEIPQGSNAAASDAAIGVLSIAKDNSVTLLFDSNNAGTINADKTLSGTLASYDPNTGRGVISMPGGFQGGFLDSAAIYLYDNGEGFVVDIDSTNTMGTTNRGFSGTMARQLPGPFNSQSISGSLIGISGAGGGPGIPNVAAALETNPTSLTLTGMAYATSTQGGQLSNVSFQGTFDVTDPRSGRGNAMLPAGFYGDFTPQAMAAASFYLIGANRFVSIGIQSKFSSGVSYFSPE